MNPLYNMLMGGGMTGNIPQQIPAASFSPGFQNPIQKMNFIMQAMANPAQFVRQNLRGIPERAFDDPTGNTVLQYMMNNMGLTQQDIQSVLGQMPNFYKR